LHIGAVLHYRFVKRLDLIRAMVTGDRHGINAEPVDDGPALWLRAAVMLAVSAALTGYVVTL
jgi:hypothetical protein